MHLAWKKDWTIILLLFLMLRLVYSLLGLVVASGPDPEPLADGPIYVAANSLLHPDRLSQQLVNVWMRWDTGWYLKIAFMGYDPTDGTIAFQPLYPWLAGLLGRLIGEPLLSALLVSNLAALATLLLLYEVARTEGMKADGSLRTVISLAFFPTAFFLFSGYTDSLFLALVLGSWLSARRGMWLLAGILAGLATLCRLQGVLLTAVLAWAWLAGLAEPAGDPFKEVGAVWRLISSREGWLRILAALRKPAWLGLLLPGAALLGWSISARLVGLGSIPAALEAHWGIHTVAPWAGFWYLLQRLFTTPRVFMDYIDLLGLVAILALLVIGLRQLDPALSLLSWLTLALFLMRGTPPHLLDSFSRYLLAIFPAFLVMGRIHSQPLRLLLWTSSFSLQVFLLMGFLDWRWIA